MEKILLLLAAIALIILGARGTYAAVWNQYFPNEQIVTTPVNTTPNATTPGQGAYVVPAQPNSTANQSSQPPVVRPNQTVTGSGNAATNTTGATSPGQHVTVITGGSVYPNQTVGRTRSAVITTGTLPSWWPSWLPAPSWLYSGAGQTGQSIPTPGIIGGN